MKIKKLHTSRVRLLRHDQIPMSAILTETHLLELKTLFSFANADVARIAESEILVRLQGGIFDPDGRKAKIVDLGIFERKLLLNIEGTTDDAQAIFGELYKKFINFDPALDENDLVPIVTADETEIVSNLDFEFSTLFSQAFGSFIQDKLGSSLDINGVAKAVLRPKQISFDVDYLVDNSLNEFNIDVSKKEFRIGPRPGTPIDEKVFLSKAPVDSETHKQLLNALEDACHQS